MCLRLTPGFVIWTAIFVGLAALLIEFFGQSPTEPQVAMAAAGAGGVIALAASEVPAESTAMEPEPVAEEAAATTVVAPEDMDDTQT